MGEAAAEHGSIDAVVSTDGDSDRPLILGVDAGKVRFFPGDLVGMVVARVPGRRRRGRADQLQRCHRSQQPGPVLEPKTRIGSPYVIAGMEQARNKGKKAICGWEANGGFLLGSDIEREGRVLGRLATRDAFLPILCVLFAAAEKGVSLSELFDELPRRFSRAALLKRFPRSTGLAITKQTQLDRFFPPELGFGTILGLDRTDGMRISFSNGDIAHIRPSGNADELRIYAVANTQDRAEQIAQLGVAEPDGILRRMEKAVTGA